MHSGFMGVSLVSQGASEQSARAGCPTAEDPKGQSDL